MNVKRDGCADFKRCEIESGSGGKSPALHDDFRFNLECSYFYRLDFDEENLEITIVWQSRDANWCWFSDLILRSSV
tara:strand:+ start:8731 stop:8958 length:228 start_codon:yes stop_codon:yes gene_type:complete